MVSGSDSDILVESDDEAPQSPPSDEVGVSAATQKACARPLLASQVLVEASQPGSIISPKLEQQRAEVANKRQARDAADNIDVVGARLLLSHSVRLPHGYNGARFMN